MDIQKVVGIINQIKEIPILNDINVKNGIFTSLDSRSSVHYIIYPLLSFLGYNVFNPAEVKVNDGKDVTILEGNSKLIKINLVDFDSIHSIEYNVLKHYNEDVKLQIWTTGIHYSLYSRKDKIIDFDIRELDKVNIELVLKILLKESLVNSINNDKFFKELLVESKFGNLRNSIYVREALEKELINPSREFINLLVDSIYEGYCEKMDKGILRDKLTDELSVNKGSLLKIFERNDEIVEAVEDFEVVEEVKKESVVSTENDPYLTLDEEDTNLTDENLNDEGIGDSTEIISGYPENNATDEDIPVIEDEEKDDLDKLLEGF